MLDINKITSRLGWRRLKNYVNLSSRSYLHHNSWTSKNVQKAFVDFFQAEQHTMIKSSSVLPWNDPSLAFVNAGMNQFKSVLLGQAAPPCPRAVNSQKCIRVGGKHNDLAAVGADSYHHTFFEMLGSWSFGDYFKEEACSYAWRLLTDVYGLPPDRLYVTYFAGDTTLNIPPDYETRDIWLRIGVTSERVLPFGMADNFWEMGTVGPCGPCTEIHYSRQQPADHLLHGVNEGLESVIELWNLVFVQYERLQDGTITALPRHHVDTGMGLERITAVLNDVTSNYDTDLFLPIFETIQQVSGAAPYTGSFSGSGASLDTGYRILADHTRMAVVALADNCLPNNSNALRKVLRRLYHTAEESFDLTPDQDWLSPVAQRVAATLHCRYPEVTARLPTSQAILRHELHHYRAAAASLQPLWKRLVESEPLVAPLQPHATQSLVEGLTLMLPELRRHGLTSAAAVRLNHTFGVHVDILEDISAIFNSSLDIADYEAQRQLQKRESRARALGGGSWRSYSLDDIAVLLTKEGLRQTDRAAVYDYSAAVTANVITDNASSRDNLLARRARSSNTLIYKTSTTNVTNCSRNETSNNIALQTSQYPTNFPNVANSSICTGNISYIYEPLETSIVAIISEEKLVQHFNESEQHLGIVLQKSNFYCAAGGQVSDKGTIFLVSPDGTETVFKVEEAEEIAGYVIHWGTLSGSPQDNINGGISVGTRVFSTIDASHRLSCSQHHTATHLFHAALQHVTGPLTHQLSSHVTAQELLFEAGTYGSLNTDHIHSAEQLLRDSIRRGGSPVTRCQISLQDALNLPHVTLLPGAVYPDTVTLVQCGSLLPPNTTSSGGDTSSSTNTISHTSIHSQTQSSTTSGDTATSAELCCGTHLHNTAHLHDFVVTAVGSSGGAGVREVRAVCGIRATDIIARGCDTLRNMHSNLQRALDDEDTSSSAQAEYQNWARGAMKEVLPHRVRATLQKSCSDFPDMKRQRQSIRATEATKQLLSLLQSEEDKSSSDGASVHYLSHPHAIPKKVLRGAYNIFGDRSHVVILRVADRIRARAVVSERCIQEGASAKCWLETLLEIFPGGNIKPGTNPHSLATFTADNVPPQQPSNHDTITRDLAMQMCREYIAPFSK